MTVCILCASVDYRRRVFCTKLLQKPVWNGNEIFDCLPSLPPSADRPSPRLLSHANWSLLLVVFDSLSPSSFVNWPCVFSRTFLSSSASCLEGDLELKPIDWVSHQKRQRRRLTSTHTHTHTHNGHIVSQINLCFVRCPWCNGYRRWKWTRPHEFKTWTRVITFHIVLILLGKVWIQLFSLQIWVNSRVD